MNRLAIIKFINPGWFKQIAEFLIEHPKYAKLLQIVAVDEFPKGFNKNPYEEDPDSPRNIFETILYGMAFAGCGCDIENGKKQFLLLLNHYRQFGDDDFTYDMEPPDGVQVEKIPTYKGVINTILDNSIKVRDFTFEQSHLIESVPGMTESTVTLLHLLYGETGSDKCLPYTDKQFKRGMCMFYKLDEPTKDTPTKEELKVFTDTWTNKKVGLMFVVQYAHYSEFVDETLFNF